MTLIQASSISHTLNAVCRMPFFAKKDAHTRTLLSRYPEDENKRHLALDETQRDGNTTSQTPVRLCTRIRAGQHASPLRLRLEGGTGSVRQKKTRPCFVHTSVCEQDGPLRAA